MRKKMQFSLFAHMERYHAQDSFRQLYEEFVALCCLADKGGLSAIWTGEHHGMDFTIAPNPFLQLSDLANRTNNVRLGTATIVAPFWHPIKLAGEAAMADVITNGRLDISISRGAYEYEYQRLSPGLDAWTAGEKMREIVPAIQNIWKGNYAHAGKHWQFPAVTCSPLPIQQPHPPIWIAARDQNSHDFAVSNGCNVQVTPLWQGDEEVADLMQKFQTAVAAHAETKRPKIMLCRHTFVAETEAELVKAANELSAFYCVFGAWFKNDRPVKDARMQPMTAEEMAAIELFSPNNMRKNHVVGTPAEVIERLKWCQSLGYDEYAIWLDNGMSFESKQKTLQLFIDKVIPAFA